MSFPWPVIEADQILNDALDIAMRISTCRRARRSALTWNPSPGRPSSTRLAARGEEQERSSQQGDRRTRSAARSRGCTGRRASASAPVSNLGYSTTFRETETLCCRRGRAGRGAVPDIAGQHCRRHPDIFGKAATHRASRHYALQACRSAPKHRNIREAAPKASTKQFCSSAPPVNSFCDQRAIGGSSSEEESAWKLMRVLAH